MRVHLKLARTSIQENRTRSFLTCLGIAIGVASIILILSLMGSISQLIAGQVKNIGANLIVVRPKSTKDMVTGVIEELTASNSYQKSNLTLKDIGIISELENITAVAPIAISTNTVVTDKNQINSVVVLGTQEDFIKIQPLDLKYGSFINKNSENTVVVGHMLSLKLFNTMNAVGKTLTLMGEKFIVSGVLSQVEESINFSNVDFDNALIMNIGALDKVSGSTQIQQINIKTKNTASLIDVTKNIQKNLMEYKKGENNFMVISGKQITHPASSLFMIISSMLALVAGISLIVGGIGVMNIMLVSVAERTHEIGVRKAVGASSQNILMQFLFEALILSLMGGVLGLVLGYMLAFFISIMTPFKPYISVEIILMTFLTTLIVGVLFGIYPALKAATKNPIDSLKHYR